MRGSHIRIRSLYLIVLAVLVASVLRPGAPFGASADPIAPTPLNVCGTITAYSPTAITFSTNGVNATYPIAAVNTFTVQPGQISHDFCLVGQINAQGQIVGGNLTQNFTNPVVLCGIVGSYVASTPNTTGSLVIGGSSVPVGPNASFTGTLITTNANLCISGQINTLGQLTTATVTTNSGAMAPTIPIGVCGTIATYTAPVNTLVTQTAGQITLSTPTISVSFVIVSSAHVSAPPAFSTSPGQIVCIVGGMNPGGQLTSVTFSTNKPQTITLCGVISTYQAASQSALGALTIGNVYVSLALAASFTGQSLAANSDVCIQGTVNGIGQLVTGAVTTDPNAATATPTTTPIPAATATSTSTPAASSTPTPTVTPTPAPTATSTSTPTPTLTSTPAPVVTINSITLLNKKKEHASAHEVWTGEQVTFRAPYHVDNGGSNEAQGNIAFRWKNGKPGFTDPMTARTNASGPFMEVVESFAKKATGSVTASVTISDGPSDSAPQTYAFSVKTRPQCAKGKSLKKGKCVKK